MAKQIHPRDAACRVSCVHYAKSLPPDPIHLFFQRETIKRRQRQSEKKTDSPVKNKKGITEAAFDFGGLSLNRGRIGHSSVGGHGLFRTNRTILLGVVVANRDDNFH